MENEMQDTGILIVSVGTSNKEAKIKSMLALENTVRKNFPEYVVEQAYTSQLICRIIKKRGEQVRYLEEGLKHLYSIGIKRCIVIPTHLIYGEEFNETMETLNVYSKFFQQLKIAKPLLGKESDRKSIASLLHYKYPQKEQECMVLIGHGSKESINQEYILMEKTCQELGFTTFVGTIKGFPGVNDVIKKIKEYGFKKALLLPFMFVAGEHALHDLVGDNQSSWINRFTAEGIESRTIMSGLGELPEIQELYCEHLRELL